MGTKVLAFPLILREREREREGLGDRCVLIDLFGEEHVRKCVFLGSNYRQGEG